VLSLTDRNELPVCGTSPRCSRKAVRALLNGSGWSLVAWRALALAVSLVCITCSGPEAQVEKLIDEMAREFPPQGAETLSQREHRLRGLLRKALAPELAVLSPWTEPATVDREAVVDLVVQAHGPGLPRHLEVRGMTVELEDPPVRGIARGQLVLSASQPGDLHGRVVPFDVSVRQRGGRWIIAGVELRQEQQSLPEARP
jgi:hypothetical protein